MNRFGAHAFVWVGDWTTDSGNHAIEQAGGIDATCSLVLPKGAHMPENPEGAKRFLIEALDKVAEVGSSYLGGCIAYSWAP